MNSFVVASELPRDPSTLLVRLMAAGPLLPQTIEELRALPRTAHERVIAEPILLQLQHVLTLGELVGQRADVRREAGRPRGGDPMPDMLTLTLTLTLPAELGPAAAVISELRDRVRAVELECAAERARSGRRVLGWRAVRAQSWRAYPTSVQT